MNWAPSQRGAEAIVRAGPCQHGKWGKIAPAGRQKRQDFRQYFPPPALAHARIPGMRARALPSAAALLLLLLAAACSRPPVATLAIAPEAVAPNPAPPVPQTGGDAAFQAFIRDFQPTALAQGIRPETYARAFAGISPITGVQAAIDNQPEFAKQIWAYLDSAVSARRIADARVLLARHADTLAAIQARSGVPKEILVAIWGMETDYGASSGGYNLFAALATQAYAGPRQQFARTELLAALKLLQEHDYPVSQMRSSWAGAFGQTQFMPTSFFKYASDGDGDGRIDLWVSSPDALASAATLLVREGWQASQPWGYEVKLPANFDFSGADLDRTRPISEWAAMGVQTAGGAALPAGEDAVSVYLPAGARGPAFMLFNNFRVIMKYNNAASYALAVSLLADRMAGAPMTIAKWPREERALSRAERSQFQDDLRKLGYDPGETDGVLGRRTRSALQQYQKAKGLAADGFATAALMSVLRADALAVR